MTGKKLTMYGNVLKMDGSYYSNTILFILMKGHALELQAMDVVGSTPVELLLASNCLKVILGNS